MALAKTGTSGGVEWSATVRYYQLGAWCGDPPIKMPYPNKCAVGIADTQGVEAKTWFVHDSSQNPDILLCLHQWAHAGIGAGDPLDEEETTVGTWVCPPPPPESQPPWPRWDWDGPDSVAVDLSGTVSGLWLYKARNTEPMPDYEDGPSEPCHPLQLGMAYCWGSDNYTKSAVAGVAAASGDGHVLTPAWAPGGGGTSILATVGIGIGLTAPPGIDIDGLVAEMTDVTIAGQAVSFSGVEESAYGLRVVGSGSTLSLYIDNPASVPLDGYGFSFDVRLPIILDFDLKCADWDEAGGPTFRVPRNTPNPNIGDQYIDLVTAPYTHRCIYWYKSWGGPWQMPWDVAISLDTTWAEGNDEDVDPADLACTIEEYGLGFSRDESGDFTLWDWGHFPIRRTPALSVQWPSDVDDEPPSEWESQDPTNLVITRQSGQKTTVFTVKPGASAEVGRRELVEDYFRYFVNKGSGLGVETYGLPAAYYHMTHIGTQYDDQQQKTWDGSDIWNWENYQFLRLTYVSDSAAELTLAIDASNVVIFDDHMTGSERVTNFSYSREQVTHTFDFSIEATSAPKEIYIDLAIPYDRRLQHVDALEIRGFDGAQEDWDFEIRDLELTRYNPTTESDEDEEAGPGGQVACKITFARPDSGGLPISYTGLTAVSEGNQCCRPPDQIVTQCGEAGVDFVERLTGRETGTILDSMRTLQQWFNILNAQEGIEVDDSGQCDTGSSEYESAFVDADDNDMLGGLKAGDCAECIDDTIDPLPESETWSSLAVRPRVGRVYPASGTPIPIKVRKILHGNCHGMLLANEARAGGEITVRLWEKDPESGAVAVVADCLTDQWSRFDFDGDRGVRENRLLGITIPDDPQVPGDPPDMWYRVRNELRVFLGRPSECPEIAMVNGVWVIVD